jgi:hypothetical protein
MLYFLHIAHHCIENVHHCTENIHTGNIDVRLQRSESPLLERMESSRSRSPSLISVEDDVKRVITTNGVHNTTPMNDNPSPNHDSLYAARLLKASLTTGIPTHSRTRKSKKRVEDDPENALIKTLRQHHNMEWSAIANFLNEERLKRGEPANMTHPAVYSRFVRNAPRIAAKEGEVGFDPKDYMHLRHPMQYVDRESVKGVGKSEMVDSAESKKRNWSASEKSVEVEEQEEGETENEIAFSRELQRNVHKKSKLVEECTELQSIDKTTKLVEAVATIHRNFWVMVADELERTTGTLYDPKVVAARYASL